MAPDVDAVNLSGVPETMLLPLYHRAMEARTPGSDLVDRKAIEIAGAIDYPFTSHFGKPGPWHVMRAMRCDEQIRHYLARHPEATVVGLGEGLETQFWRVDNGKVRWLAVDLPESIEVRRRFLPDTDRHRNLACSALDFRWLDEVDASRGVIVTAQGLLCYFEPEKVRELIGLCAERFPGGIMLFDTVAKSYSASTIAGTKGNDAYKLPPMPWGVDADKVADIKSFHPAIAAVDEIDPGAGKGWTRGLSFPVRRRLGMLPANRAAFVRVRIRSR